LRCGWSPELIAGRLKKENGQSLICHETIYHFIYAKENKYLKLWEYLPKKQFKRRRRPGRKVQRVHIPDRVSIHERPAEVESRSTIGHWEADCMEGGRKNTVGVHLAVERKSRFIQATLVARIGAKEIAAAWQQIFANLSPTLLQSVTMDNGSESVSHTLLHQFGLKTFFADPYASWQKGSVEQSISLLRRYLPKGTRLTNLENEELGDIVEELNNRPRKVLEFKTPLEILDEEGVRVEVRM
jgi:IS30 family transposase